MIRTEQTIPECCYCEEPLGDSPCTTYGGSPIHTECLEALHYEMDQHREEDEPTFEEIEEANMQLGLDYAYQLYPHGGG